MKSTEVINQGEGFVTVSQRAESAREAVETLHRQGIRRVFKGDQNQLWDAVLMNQCLDRAIGDALEEGLALFVQDEKMGTPDTRLRHYWRRRGERFALTEDYYGRRSGAVWEHQDVTFGLFYTEPIDPSDFATAGIHLSRAADLWDRCGEAALRDDGFLDAMEQLGVSLRWHRADAATRLGPPVNGDVYTEFFNIRPDAGLYYSLTKSTGLYGVVPAVNDDITTSSIALQAGGLLEYAGRLLRLAVAGAMRSAGDREQRRAVKSRARRLLDWTTRYLAAHPEACVADFQTAVAAFLWRETCPDDGLDQRTPSLDLTSRFMALRREDVPIVESHDRSLCFFLDIALRHPVEFAESYNEALNRVGFGLQRVKYEATTGRYTPPFFVEYAPGGEGTPLYRFSLELSGGESMRVTLANRQVGTFVLESAAPIRSAGSLFRLLFDQLPHAERLAVVGKAAPFAAELKRWPRAMALPRQGSKYAPMIDHLLAGLRRRGALDNTCGLVLRVGVNALDALASLGDRPVAIPRFLESELGKRSTCRELADRWRGIAAAAEERLDLLHGLHVGQHVRVARVLALNAQGRDLAAEARRDPALAAFLRTGDPDGIHSADAWRRIGDDVSPIVGATLDRLLTRRQELLAERQAARSECPREVQAARRVVECQLLLIYAAYVRRLLQRAESLPYLNDRPYSLSLWLLFGPEIFGTITESAELDFEFMCEKVEQAAPCACS